MKTTFVVARQFVARQFVARQFAVALLVTAATTGLVQAQDKTEKSNEVTVKIIERSGDDVRQVDRTYKNLPAEERDKVVERLVDSLKTTRKDGKKRQLTIVVEDNDGRGSLRTKGGPGQNRLYFYKGRPGQAKGDAWVLDSENWQRDFNRGMDSLNDKLSRLEFTFPKDFNEHIIRPFDAWSRGIDGKMKAPTIRGLDAFPNNPDKDQLNLRFNAPAKGDVTISVTNPKGKEVARKEVKDFSGEFVGQIDLGKQAKGVYFITVTQNEDGAVRRVVVD
nr:T9SS type A sorting domain-containing protein [uncultured Arsenicibacter sp.]